MSVAFQSDLYASFVESATISLVDVKYTFLCQLNKNIRNIKHESEKNKVSKRHMYETISKSTQTDTGRLKC